MSAPNHGNTAEEEADPVLPVLPSLFMLACAIGLNLPELMAMIATIERGAEQSTAYATHYQRGRHGYRQIAVPSPALADVQRWILVHILSCLTPHHACHGITGRSTLTAVHPHLAADVLITTDLRSWYPSIIRTQIEAVFADLAHYPPPVAWALATLTTRDSALPQGPCASPALSNLCAIPLDIALSAEAEARGLSYTRYADDLIFSGPRVAVPESLGAARIMSMIERYAEAQGWQVSVRKTRVMRRDRDRMVALGLVLNSADAPALPREERRRVRAAQHQAQATGDPISRRDAGRLEYERHVREDGR